MAWQLKAFAALRKDLRSIPSNHVEQFTMPSDDLHRHRHSHKHRQKRKNKSPSIKATGSQVTHQGQPEHILIRINF